MGFLRKVKRGKLSILGMEVPKRPFNNKANTCKRPGKHSRALNERKKQIYFGIKWWQNNYENKE